MRRGNLVRDDSLYDSDKAYRVGWAQGHNACRRAAPPSQEPGPLADPIHRALHDVGPLFDRRQRIGDGQPQVVVIMHGQQDLGDDQIVEDAGFGKVVEPVIDKKVTSFRDNGAIFFVADAEFGPRRVEESFEAVGHEGQGLGNDFDYEWVVICELVDPFACIADEDEVFRHGGKDFLGGMDAAAAFEGG